MDMNKIKGLNQKLAALRKENKKQKTTKESLKEAINQIASRPEGILFFKALADNCGFDRGSSLIVNGELNPVTSVYYDARRSVYLELRKYIEDNYLINIEIKE